MLVNATGKGNRVNIDQCSELTHASFSLIINSLLLSSIFLIQTWICRPTCAEETVRFTG
jgi:hypothetical protein